MLRPRLAPQGPFLSSPPGLTIHAGLSHRVLAAPLCLSPSRRDWYLPSFFTFPSIRFVLNLLRGRRFRFLFLPGPLGSVASSGSGGVPAFPAGPSPGAGAVSAWARPRALCVLHGILGAVLTGCARRPRTYIHTLSSASLSAFPCTQQCRAASPVHGRRAQAASAKRRPQTLGFSHALDGRGRFSTVPKVSTKS